MQKDRETARAASGCEWSEEQRQAVRDEMQRILAHPTFHSSVRCSELLGYVVRRLLAGEAEEIKERTIGIDVFGRDASYDIGSDPVVRRIANEVRKRIAQYYQDDPDGHAVKIQLPRGHYIPEFDFPLAGVAAGRSNAAPLSSARLARLAGWMRGQGSIRLPQLAALTLLVVATIFFWGFFLSRSSVDRIWKPLVDAKAPVVICLPDFMRFMPGPPPAKGPRPAQPSNHAPGVTPPRGISPSPIASPGGPEEGLSGQTSSILFGDVAVGNSLAEYLGRIGKSYELRSASGFKYSEARRASVVLIGCLKEDWQAALLSNVRYSLRYDPATGEGWIQDAQDPSNRQWKSKAPPERWHATQDYALVTRVFNEETGQWVLALSGISGRGTQAAGRLLTDPRVARKVRAHIRDTGNFQIVLHLALMSEEPGPVEIVTVYTW